MLRTLLATAAVALLLSNAMAQDDLRSRLRPIAAPLKHAGVYHVATGTWTRGARQSILGPDIIYNNSCSPVYFGVMESGLLYQHRSRLPTTALNGAPEADSVFYPGDNPAHQYDKRPGCDVEYVLQHFQVAYCSSRPATAGTFDWFFSFADSYSLCGFADMVADPLCDYLVTGLPGGTITGAQNCWTVDVDLSLVTPECSLSADQDGTYVGPRESEQFGYSQGPATAGIPTAHDTGPVVAGNFTSSSGPFVPCTGADGTIWDSPINLAEAGTGMNSNDFLRVTGPASSFIQGCHFFGGLPHADFFLKLYSKSCGTDPGGGMSLSCRPGIDPGLIPCPCGNPPVPPGLGCDNFGAGPVQSAVLDATGNAWLSNDTITLIATGENNASLNVFWTGRNPLNPTGVIHGAGVRCVTVDLKRLYNHSAVAGTVSAPQGADVSVSARTAQVYGAPIAPGETRQYFNIYRDPQAASPCGVTSSTVNLTNSGGITWAP